MVLFFRKVHGVNHSLLDERVEFWSGEHAAAFAVAIGIAVLFVMGLPLLIIVRMRGVKGVDGGWDSPGRICH
jgi:hypothetical protein